MTEKSIEEIEAIAAMCHVANRAWCAMHGVVHALTFPDAKPEDSHNNWMALKMAEGWVYGEFKDPVAKTHPCMLPYDQLPEWQQKKDALFLAIVRALA